MRKKMSKKKGKEKKEKTKFGLFEWQLPNGFDERAEYFLKCRK